MKLKDRIKTYNFWVSLSSAIFLLIKLLGNQFGFSVNESLFNDLITTLCGILVILGIIVPPTNKMTTTTNDNNITSNEASTETNLDKLKPVSVDADSTETKNDDTSLNQNVEFDNFKSEDIKQDNIQMQNITNHDENIENVDDEPKTIIDESSKENTTDYISTNNTENCENSFNNNILIQNNDNICLNQQNECSQEEIKEMQAQEQTYQN